MAKIEIKTSQSAIEEQEIRLATYDFGVGPVNGYGWRLGAALDACGGRNL